MKFLFAIFFYLIAGVACASNYYVSNAGSDGNTGSITQSWQTLSRVNSSLQHKDSVFFKRGDSFFGTLIVSNDSLFYGAYGSGNNPVISGFTHVNAWNTAGTNLWESGSAVSLLPKCNLVTIDGVNTPKGRYPNVGFDTIVSHNGNTSITGSMAAIADWTGAELVIRILRYGYDINRITSQTGNTIQYTSIDNMFLPIDGHGFFIQNDPRTLDLNNEWYFNPTTKKLLLYNSSTPNNINVASIDTLVIINNHNYINFKNLNFEGSNKLSIAVIASTHVTIENCQINFSGQSGIETGSASHYLTINNCKIFNSNDIGVLNDNSTNLSIYNSAFSKSGMFAGMGGLYYSNIATSQFSAGHYKAIQSCGDSAKIINNTIDTTGYIPIYFTGSDVLIENNFINRYCFLLDDGGGIYSYSEFRDKKWLTRIIRNNIILNGIGAPEGCLNFPQYTNQTAGIYLDASNSDFFVSGNTVAYSNKGVYINNSKRVNIEDNILYNNTVGIYTSNYTDAYKLSNVEIVRNTVITYPTSGDITYTLYTILLPDSLLPATFRFNYNAYVNTNDSFNIRTLKPSVATYDHSFSQWKAYSGNDISSYNQVITSLQDITFVYNTSEAAQSGMLANKSIDPLGNTYAPGTYSIMPHQSRIFIKKSWINTKSFYKRKPVRINNSPALPI